MVPRLPGLRGAVLWALLPLAAPSARADPPSFLPAVFGRLEAARYVPDDEEQAWTAWIGAGADLLKAGTATFEFTADMETIIGRELRTFDPNQANYHLRAAMRLAIAGDELIPFFDHVSRHAVDRPKTEPVDWNTLGARARLAFGGGRGRATVGVGRIIGDSPVGYKWEITGRGELDAARHAYAFAEVRRVVAEPVPRFPRGSFTDWWVEGGARWRGGAEALDVFAAFERRNDVFVQAPGVKDRLLVGFRIGPPSRRR